MRSDSDLILNHMFSDVKNRLTINQNILICNICIVLNFIAFVFKAPISSNGSSSFSFYFLLAHFIPPCITIILFFHCVHFNAIGNLLTS